MDFLNKFAEILQEGYWLNNELHEKKLMINKI